MTATDPGDRATLQQCAKTFGDQAASCRLLAESHSHTQILPTGSGHGVGGSLSLSSSPGGGLNAALLSARHTAVAYSPSAGTGTVVGAGGVGTGIAGSQMGSYMAMGNPASNNATLQ